MYKRVFGVLFTTVFLFWMQGCSNVEVGFEEGSIFYTKKEDPYASERVLSVYLDPLLEKSSYRLMIDGEDTQVTLHPGSITRFGIYKDEADIVLIAKKKRLAALHLLLPGKKEYALRIFLNDDGRVKMQPVAVSLLPKNAPRSGLYVSQKPEQISEKKTPTKSASKEQEEQRQDEEGETTVTYELDDGE